MAFNARDFWFYVLLSMLACTAAVDRAYSADHFLANRACVFDANSKLDSSAVTATELGYVSGASSNLQTQITGKEPAISAGLSSQYFTGLKTWATLDTSAVAENANQYFTAARARASVSGSAPISYSSSTGAFSIPVANDAADGYMSAAEHAQVTSNVSAISSLQAQAHAPVTIGTANGLSLATQALSLALATDSVPGAMSAADHTQLTANTANISANTSSISGHTTSITALQSYSHDETTTRDQYPEFCDEFINAQTNMAGTVWTWAGASGSASPLFNNSISNGHPGIINLQVNAAASARTSIMTAQRSLVLDATKGIQKVEWLASLQAAADATNDYILQLGFADNITRANTLYAADFVIYRASGVTNASTNWQCHLQNGNPGTASDSYIDTGVAMDTAWHKFKVTHGEGGSAVVRFYIDGVQKCGDQTTNIPSTTNLTNINATLESVGTPAATRSVYLDKMCWTNALTISR